MQRARCKFTVTAVTPSYDGAPPTSQRVRMSTQYDQELAQEDEAFAKSTPSGDMTFQVDNPALAGFFEPGKAYYIDITPATGG